MRNMKNSMQINRELYNYPDLSLVLSRLISDKQFRETFSGDNLAKELSKQLINIPVQGVDRPVKQAQSSGVKNEMGFDDRLLLSCYVGY